MMTCRQLTDFLCDYIDGDLPGAVRETFESHLLVCKPCVHYMESYRTTVALARSLGTPDPCPPAPVEDGEMPEPLIQAILEAREAREGREADREGGGDADGERRNP